MTRKITSPEHVRLVTQAVDSFLTLVNAYRAKDGGEPVGDAVSRYMSRLEAVCQPSQEALERIRQVGAPKDVTPLDGRAALTALGGVIKDPAWREALRQATDHVFNGEDEEQAKEGAKAREAFREVLDSIADFCERVSVERVRAPSWDDPIQPLGALSLILESVPPAFDKLMKADQAKKEGVKEWLGTAMATIDLTLLADGQDFDELHERFKKELLPAIEAGGYPIPEVFASLTHVLGLRNPEVKGYIIEVAERAASEEDQARLKELMADFDGAIIPQPKKTANEYIVPALVELFMGADLKTLLGLWSVIVQRTLDGAADHPPVPSSDSGLVH